MKGLKQIIADALRNAGTDRPPVRVSGDARRDLTAKVREWSGLDDATLLFEDPISSPYASYRPETHEFRVNVDNLSINPNRVLLTITPFRLRQEAILTGALLHEAGHARHSHWLPKGVLPTHNDDTVASEATISLARLCEEARIEGLLAAETDSIGAAGLGWTLRASAMALLPTTTVSQFADKAVMDFIKSWVLRAGRRTSLNNSIDLPLDSWVSDFTSLLHKVLVAHFKGADHDDPESASRQVIGLLILMCEAGDKYDYGSYLLDRAREVLDLLFPETPEDERPGVGGSCSSESGEGGDQTEQADAGQSDDESDQGDKSDQGDETGEGDDGKSGDSDDRSDEDGESGQGEGEGGGDGEGDGKPDPLAQALAQALAELEAAVSDEAADDAESDSAKSLPGGITGSDDNGQTSVSGWRMPSPTEREMQRGAERFLRDLVDPSESSKVLITDSPSAMVDGAALASWRASGGVRDPKFFRRTHRETVPAPPVQIAVLVDVSASMEVLQDPSALLSWALSSAALDLRNFAGRGQQVKSTLIHWGNHARIIQPVGGNLPGIRTVQCNESTSAMDEALAMVEEQMPGFFDVQASPVNRLLVQFTDWELFGGHGVTPYIRRALEAGVNMITVAPKTYGTRWSRTSLPEIMRHCTVQRGRSMVLKYNPMFPEQVWEEAATALTF